MFASQLLLRILETIPSDVSMYETSCSSEQDMTINENPNTTTCASPLVLNNCEYEARNSPEKGFQYVPMDHPKSLQVDAVSLSYSDANPNVGQIRSLNASEPEDSMSPSTAALTLIKACNSFRTNKTVLECDTPELMACYKDMNYHVMKDICIDEGKPLCDRSFFRSSEDEVQIPKSKSQSESHSDEDAAEDLTSKTEKGSVTTDETVSDGSIEDSFIDRGLPIQEFGTRSFLRSFIISLDEGNDKTAQMLDQISSEKAIPEGPPTSSAESDLKEAMLASSSFSYNSKVESKIITFNFNSRAPEKSRTKEPSVDSRDKLDHKYSDSHSLSYSTRVHCEKDACNKNVHEESLKVEDMADKNVHNQLLSDSGDDDSFDVGLYVPKVSDDFIKRNRGKHEHGETSFSDASFITHSGPIPFSGSISFRSDSSATSGKSFAFPVLQSEWNSSPVRMTTAERRHFRKHKFWRSGLLCCRF